MTPNQLRLIHTGARKVGLDDARYRLLLVNAAGVGSAKDLTNEQFEDVMAVLEDLGFPGRYWRGRVEARGSRATERMAWKARELYAAYVEIRDDADPTTYKLEGLVERLSNGRTRIVEQLLPRECWNLIEALKKILAREENHEAAKNAKDHEEIPAQEIPF